MNRYDYDALRSMDFFGGGGVEGWVGRLSASVSKCAASFCFVGHLAPCKSKGFPSLLQCSMCQKIAFQSAVVHPLDAKNSADIPPVLQ